MRSSRASGECEELLDARAHQGEFLEREADLCLTKRGSGDYEIEARALAGAVAADGQSVDVRGEVARFFGDRARLLRDIDGTSRLCDCDRCASAKRFQLLRALVFLSTAIRRDPYRAPPSQIGT